MFEAIQSWDVSVLYAMRSYQPQILLLAAAGVSTLAWKGWLWWPVIVLSWFKGNRMFSAHLAAAIGLATVLGLPMKSLIARPRPDLYSSIVNHIPMPELLSTQHSFPSGHTLLAAAFAGVIVMYYRDWRAVLACLFVVAVGIARVYEAMHWPSDVIGSAILGGLAAYAGGLIVRIPAINKFLTKRPSSVRLKPGVYVDAQVEELSAKK